MIDRADAADRVALDEDLLARIVRPIVEHFAPHRIILFGSRARGDARPDSDWDVLVELETELGEWECISAIERTVDRTGFALSVCVRAPGVLERRRDDPGTIEWDIARQGIVLWSASGEGIGPLAYRPKTPRVRERPPEPPESVGEFVVMAEEDLLALSAIVAAERVAWSAGGFHAQQAAEKYLKALLVSRWVRPPRTHDLHQLVAAARATGCDLPDLHRECEALNPYAVELRYRWGGFIPDEATGRTVVAAGYRIVELAKGLLPPPQA